MSIASKQREDWQSCESGYLVALSERAKYTRRKRLVLRASAGVAALVCAVGLGLWTTAYWGMPNENYFGGIACHEVQENMPAMLAGTLPDELKARIEAHLRQCPACRETMQKMRANQAAADLHRDYWACECPECQRLLAQTVLQRPRATDANQRVLATSVPLARFADRQ